MVTYKTVFNKTLEKLKHSTDKATSSEVLHSMVDIMLLINEYGAYDKRVDVKFKEWEDSI